MLKIITTILIFPALIPFMASFMLAFHTPAHFRAIDSLSADTLYYDRSDRASFYKCRKRGKSVFCLLYGNLGTDSTSVEVNVRRFYWEYGDGMSYELYERRYLRSGPASEPVWRSLRGGLVVPRAEDTLDVWGMKKHRVRNLLVFHLPFWLLLLIRMKLIPRWEKKDDLNQKTG